MHIKKYQKVTSPLAAGLLLLAVAAPLVLINSAHAASLTEVAVRFDRMKISTQTTGTVCAMPASTATEASVQVTYPTGYTLGAFGTFTVDTTNTAWPTGAVAWTGITAPASAGNISGQTVTFGSGDLNPATLYCFNWTTASAVTVSASATSSNTGSVTTRTSVPATIDTNSYSTASIADDQIVVTATVPSVFSFSLSGNTDPLGTLSSTAVVTSPTPRTATINTNARNGWMVWAKDTNIGLLSATASSTIASRSPGTNSTLTNGTNGYNTGVTSTITSGGAITVAAPFVGSSAGQGGGLDTSMRTLASSGGVADTAVLTLKNNVSISPTQAAASDYTDTITVVGAGLF
jgi:hypothetical protein